MAVAVAVVQVVVAVVVMMIITDSVGPVRQVCGWSELPRNADLRSLKTSKLRSRFIKFHLLVDFFELQSPLTATFVPLWLNYPSFAELGNLVNFEDFFGLGHNSLHGKIPTQLGRLTSVTKL